MKLSNLALALVMMFSLVFLGEMISTNGDNALSAKGQTVTVRRKRSGGLYGASKRGVKYIYRKGKNGTVYVYRKTKQGTVYVGRKTYQGGKYVGTKTYQGGKYVGKKTVGGVKKVGSVTKKVLVGN